MFKDRIEAAQKLAEKLSPYKGQNPLVLAIPRGAVPMAKVIADALGGEVDVVLVHKIGAPGNPEFAIGAVDEHGHIQVSDYARAMGIPEDYIQKEAKAQIEKLRERRKLYTPVRPPIDPQGRIVIVVDDGVATGSTMIAALNAIRAKKPKKLIAAAAVAPPDAVQRIAPYADEVVFLETPEYFFAVGQFFQHFPQVSDEEVIRILEESGKKGP